MREILSSGLLKRVKPGSRLMADGAAAWSAAARTLSAKRFTVHHVKHSRAQFVKRVPACQRTLGTQTLDRVWDVLKRYIPKEISSRKIKDGRSDLLLYVYSCLWRRQVTQMPLLHALGKLCRDC